MTDFAQRGPLGQKAPKPDKPPRKGVKPVSDKKRAHKASTEGKSGLAHMARVKMLPCLVCGVYGVEVHHLPHPRSDLRTVPLCPQHHRTEYGPQAYHYSRRNFNAMHGTDEQLLARTMEQIDRRPKRG